MEPMQMDAHGRRSSRAQGYVQAEEGECGGMKDGVGRCARGEEDAGKGVGDRNDGRGRKWSGDEGMQWWRGVGRMGWSEKGGALQERGLTGGGRC